MYKSDIFKLVIKNGYIRHDLSIGLDIIKERISNHVQGLIIEKTACIDGHISIFTKSSEKKEIIEYIHKQTFKNSFLKYPATLLNENDNVIAIIENNNGNEEEALLFIFNRGEYSYLLWENINLKRAAYIFCFDIKTTSKNTSEIIQLIITNSEHKRESLFRGVDVNEVYKINCIAYKSIVHEVQQDYIHNLDRILSFQFERNEK